MTRRVCFVLLILAVAVLAGCEADTGRGQLITAAEKGSWDPGLISFADTRETDLVEQVSASRQMYRRSLEMLIGYYSKTGNSLKHLWAERELREFDGMAQYNYIIEATLAGADLEARDSITAADELYAEALQIEKQAGALILIRDDNLLRQALDKYNQLIRRYPTSDKIDDAAYNAAKIHRHFNDLAIAMLYYRRTYQWNPNTVYPARSRAAYILDQHLARRDEALELYKEALEKEKLSDNYKQFIQMRIAELTRGDKAAE